MSSLCLKGGHRGVSAFQTTLHAREVPTSIRPKFCESRGGIAEFRPECFLGDCPEEYRPKSSSEFTRHRVNHADKLGVAKTARLMPLGENPVTFPLSASSSGSYAIPLYLNFNFSEL